MSERLKIGVDLDGVVARFVPRFHEIARSLFGRPDYGHIQTKWDWSDTGLSETEVDAVWKNVRNTNNFWQALGKEEGTATLFDATLKYDVYFITHRVPTVGRSVVEQSAKWLEYNFQIEYPQVIATKHKGEVAKALRLRAFIDDYPENVVEVAEVASINCSCFLRDTPYNRHVELPRVKTLDEFLEALP